MSKPVVSDQDDQAHQEEISAVPDWLLGFTIRNKGQAKPAI